MKEKSELAGPLALSVQPTLDVSIETKKQKNKTKTKLNKTKQVNQKNWILCPFRLMETSLLLLSHQLLLCSSRRLRFRLIAFPVVFRVLFDKLVFPAVYPC